MGSQDAQDSFNQGKNSQRDTLHYNTSGSCFYFFFFNSSNLLTIVEMEKILNAADSSIERESRSVVSDSLQPHGLYSPGNSPAQDTGVGSLLLLQGIFLT